MRFLMILCLLCAAPWVSPVAQSTDYWGKSHSRPPVATSSPTEQKSDYWGQRLAYAPTQFLFGYGSLVNTASRNATAGRPIPAVPARISTAFGHVRSWGEHIPTGFTALVVRRAHSGEAPTTINGVLYPVDEKELPRFDEREIGYKRAPVPLNVIESAGWQRLPADANIWIYVFADNGARPEDHAETPDRNHPILQSYIDLVVEGALEYGEDFAGELIGTIGDWNQFWLNDRELPRRPWVFNKSYRTVDRVLAGTAPASFRFKERAFPEVFSARFFGAEQR